MGTLFLLTFLSEMIKRDGDHNIFFLRKQICQETNLNILLFVCTLSVLYKYIKSLSIIFPALHMCEVKCIMNSIYIIHIANEGHFIRIPKNGIVHCMFENLVQDIDDEVIYMYYNHC